MERPLTVTSFGSRLKHREDGGSCEAERAIRPWRDAFWTQVDSGGVGMKEERLLTVLLSLLRRAYRAWPLRTHCCGRHTLACQLSMPLQHHMSVEEQCRREL
jgi:hypothetical protein